ncbi:MAG: uroporphyrinogen decarboxylase family protein [Thermofilaceae archaeon]
MNSRERCIRCFEHEQLDRVPLNFKCRPEPLNSLMEALQVKDYEQLLRALDIDFRSTGPILAGGLAPPKYVKLASEWVYGPTYALGRIGEYELRANIWGVETIWAPDHTYTYTYLRHPLQHISVEEYNWPYVDEEATFEVASRARKLHADYCLVAGVEHLWENAWQLTGFNEAMKMMYRDPVTFEKILNHLHRIRMVEAKVLCDAGVDVIYDGDDVGMQKGMMISPEKWRLFLKPKYVELVDLCHKRGAYFMFHSDGWIEPIIPDLIEIHVDILDPVQPECMDPYKLKKTYGDLLTLHGTMSVQTTLLFSNSNEIEKLVLERLNLLGPTGFVLSPTHDIQPGTPLENILAVYKAARKASKSLEKV